MFVTGLPLCPFCIKVYYCIKLAHLLRRSNKWYSTFSSFTFTKCHAVSYFVFMCNTISLFNQVRTPQRHTKTYMLITPPAISVLACQICVKRPFLSVCSPQYHRRSHWSDLTVPSPLCPAMCNAVPASSIRPPCGSWISWPTLHMAITEVLDTVLRALARWATVPWCLTSMHSHRCNKTNSTYGR